MAHTYRDLPAAGTTLYLEIGYAYTEIPGATDISWEGFKRGVRTPTPLSALAVVKKPGMSDFGQVKCKVYFDPNETTHQDIRDRLLDSAATASANLDNWKLEYADGFATPAHATFTGFVSEFSHSATDPETGTMTADLTIEVSGQPTFVDGAPPE